MRWPKGPPHVTLKPFQIKQKQKPKNKQNPTTKTKQTKTNKKQNKTNKEGLGPIEVPQRATSPDP